MSAMMTVGACDDPELYSSLRPEGAPEVLTVTVQNDAVDNYLEGATFCKLDDIKRPTEVFVFGHVEIVCPLDQSAGVDMVEDALPMGWYVRIVFDELLDPNVEELIPNRDPNTNEEDGTFSGSIATTAPVSLNCGGTDIPYDGYYQPGGNLQTWPLGPSLMIIPDDPTSVATGTTCEIELNGVAKDKSGNVVPEDQRGPFMFAIAPLSLASTSPIAVADPEDQQTVVPTAPVSLTFNAPVDPASFTTADVQIFRGADPATCTGGTALGNVAVSIFQIEDDEGNVADPTSIQLADATATGAAAAPEDPADTGNRFEPGETYRIEFMNAMIADTAGGEGTIDLGETPGETEEDPPIPNVLCFTTSDGT